MPSEKKSKQVLVLDSDKKALSYTSSAKARILLGKNKALVYHKDPFVIQLTKGESEEQMQSSRSNEGSYVVNFTEYFKDTHEVYVQNLGSTQISLSFGTKDNAYYHVVPATRRPYNLTQYIPFELIKISQDFRRIVNRRPPILNLITEEECTKYYEKLSESNGTTVEDEMGKVSDMINRLVDHIVPSNAGEKLPERLRIESENILEKRKAALEQNPQTHPRAVGLCALAHEDQGSSRISAGDFIEELERLSDIFTVNDWKFVMTNSPYKTVSNLCAKMIEKAS